MFEPVNIATAQVVPSMGLLDRLFKSKRPGEGEMPPAAPSPPRAAPGPPEPAVAEPTGPSMPAPTMLIRPKGPGMTTGGVPGGMPRPPAPQGTTGGTHGGIGVPVQITQRISLRPGAGGPPQGAPQAKPKKETQRFALAPAPTQQVAAEAGAAEAGDVQRLILPLGMVLRSLPPEVLITDVGQLLARPVVAGGTVSVPMNQVLRQLPTGVVQFTFDVLQPQIPAEMLQPPDQLATHWDRPVRFPLGEVVSRIPPDAMGLRGSTSEQGPDFESIDAPFRVRAPGPRGRRTSKLSAPIEEEVVQPMASAGGPDTASAPPPSTQAPPAMAAPVLGGAAPGGFEGFEPFRKMPVPPEPASKDRVEGVDAALASEMPFQSALPPSAPLSKSPPKASPPDLGMTAVQKAPTMGITGKISLEDVDQDIEIQREPTQRLGKPPPGLIAVRPPATSSLPFVSEAEEAQAIIGPPEVSAGPGPTQTAEPLGAVPSEEPGGGLSALASLAAMADSGPMEPEEESAPAAPVEAQREAEIVQVAPPAEGGDWWGTTPKPEAEQESDRPVEAGSGQGSLADLASQWLAMQKDTPFEAPKGPAAEIAEPAIPEFKETPPKATPPPVAAPEQPAAPKAKNWWEMPLDEPGLGDEIVIAQKEPEPPVTRADDFAGAIQPVGPEAAPPEDVGFPPPGIGAPRDKGPVSFQPVQPLIEEQPPPIFAEKAVLKPEAAPGFIPPPSAVVPDIRRKVGAPPMGPSAPPMAAVPTQKPRVMTTTPAALSPPGGAPILPLAPRAPMRPPQPPRPPLVQRPEPEPIPEPEFAPQAFAFPVEPAPAPVRPKPAPAPRKPVTLPSAGRIGSQGRPKGAAPAPQPKRETEAVGTPRQRSPIPVPKLRADRMSGLLRATSTWTPPGAAAASRPINPRRILSRWLGLEVEKEVPIHLVPALLVNSPHVKGAAIVDEEGLALTSQLPEGVSEQAVGALSSRLFNQLKTAAGEVGSQFSNQAIMTLGRWTVQITYEKPFYLVTLHDSPHFPPAVARRMRKIAGALVRQEFGG